MILLPYIIKSLTVSIVSPSMCHEVMGSDAMIFIFWMLTFKPAFSLSFFTFIRRLFSSSLSAIRVVSSEVIDISPGNLDSNLCLSSLAVRMMYSAYKLNKQGEYTAFMYSFPNLKPVCCSISNSNCCFLTCKQVFQEAGQVVWYSHLLKNFR